ncbi:MAG: glycoside hydrolase family 140 protein [Chloroflexi bacterium]|nr:glycoside hydrolase family 140 protein [Chloroflexota bacterium]
MVKLCVSANRRFLADENGHPFFYLADTAWELFHRCNREEADRYLADRAAKGFTVIQAVVLAELDGLTEPNAYGHLPLVDRDPTRPNEAYFEHVDYIVERAEALRLFIGMLPTWGKYVTDVWQEHQVIFEEDSARWFGEYLGQRYRDRHIIWILGGDRPADGRLHVYRALAEGLRAGDGGQHLIGYHPQGQRSSSIWAHQEPWLDINMCQSGHLRRSNENWAMIAADYALQPPKPCLDAEPCYEEIAVGFNPGNGYFGAHDVRKAAYWAVFSGAAGHTYGCNNIWQMYAPGRRPILHPTKPWYESLDLPGAFDMRHLKALMLSRPYFTRIPDPSLALSNRLDPPGKLSPCGSDDYVAVTRDGSPGQRDATYLMAYFPMLRSIHLDTSVITGGRLRAWWYDPREGVATLIGEMANPGHWETPRLTSGPDWVLVIDDVACGYPPPGQREAGSPR